jgi:hypothetical protein
LRAAIVGFKELINNTVNAQCIEILFKNLVAVLNANANLHLQKYIMDGESDETLIESARIDISEIKNLFNVEPLMSLNYYGYPTYVVTELEVSYFEIGICLKHREVNKAREKILESLFQKRTLDKRGDLFRFVDQHFLDRIEKIERLASDFFKDNLKL